MWQAAKSQSQIQCCQLFVMQSGQVGCNLTLNLGVVLRLIFKPGWLSESQSSVNHCRVLAVSWVCAILIYCHDHSSEKARSRQMWKCGFPCKTEFDKKKAKSQRRNVRACPDSIVHFELPMCWACLARFRSFLIQFSVSTTFNSSFSNYLIQLTCYLLFTEVNETMRII